jgi:Flp pilus assembly protein TadG
VVTMLLQRLPSVSTERSRGQALVELALILPVLILLVMGTIDFGRALDTYIAMVGAAGEGARTGADPNATYDQIKNAVISEASTDLPGLTAADITICDIDSAGNQRCSSSMPARTGIQPGGVMSVKVTVKYRFRPVTPFINRLFGGTWTLSASAVRQVM